MAEQQRESEELLHNGVAAFERGEIEAARQMLNAAVQRGGAHDVALAFLNRIDRISAAMPASPAPVAAPSRSPFRPRTETTGRPASPWLYGLTVTLVVAAVVVTIGSWDALRALMPALGNTTEDGLAPVKLIEEPLIVPRSSETALDRARSLFASGRLYDALRAVDLVRPTDPLRGDADKLKAEIQRQLLDYQTSPGGAELTRP
jgi:hypothetical protein